MRIKRKLPVHAENENELPMETSMTDMRMRMHTRRELLRRRLRVRYVRKQDPPCVLPFTAHFVREPKLIHARLCSLVECWFVYRWA